MIDRYKRRNISEISKDDLKIVLIGKIIEVKENSFVLDDKTGKIEIFWDGEVENNKYVRVFCTRVNDEFKADIVQPISEREAYLFKKFNELYKRVEEYV